MDIIINQLLIAILGTVLSVTCGVPRGEASAFSPRLEMGDEIKVACAISNDSGTYMIAGYVWKIMPQDDPPGWLQ